jgi:hypothetical protein
MASVDVEEWKQLRKLRLSSYVVEGFILNEEDIQTFVKFFLVYNEKATQNFPLLLSELY